MTPRRLTLSAFLDAVFRPGETIYLPGGVGEVRAIRDALQAEPDRLTDVSLISGLLPGMNGFDYASLNPRMNLSVFMLSRALRAGFDAGRTSLEPLSYSQIARRLDERPAGTAVVHLTSPVDGECSFGVCADFGPIAARRAGRVFGVVNASMPRPRHAPRIALNDLAGFVEVDEPLATPPTPSPASLALESIAGRVADLIPDGAVLQTGLGGAPEQVWRALSGRRGLRLWSGMITDGFLEAEAAGSLRDDGHVAGIAWGSERLMQRLDGATDVSFADVSTTHDVRMLADVPAFHAVNAALEIDLFGQANLEWLEGRLVSGVGGAPDFMAAARRDREGRAILCLPASAMGGTRSRVVPRLTTPTVSLPSTMIDAVVTEHGVADLDCGLDQRAERLIDIAAPDHRASLTESWAALRAAL